MTIWLMNRPIGLVPPLQMADADATSNAKPADKFAGRVAGAKASGGPMRASFRQLQPASQRNLLLERR